MFHCKSYADDFLQIESLNLMFYQYYHFLLKTFEKFDLEQKIHFVDTLSFPCDILLLHLPVKKLCIS